MRNRSHDQTPHPQRTRGAGPYMCLGRISAQTEATCPVRSPPLRRSRRTQPAADNLLQWQQIPPAGQQSTPFWGDPSPPPRRQYDEPRSLPDRQGPTKFRAPLAGRPIGDFGNLSSGSGTPTTQPTLTTDRTFAT